MPAIHLPFDTRAAYHLVRRSLTKHSVYDGKHNTTDLSAYGRASAETRARDALLAQAGLERLPRGTGDLPRLLADAVVDARRALHQSSLVARLARRRRALYLQEADRRGLPTVLHLAKNPAQDLMMVSETRTQEGYHVGLLRAEGWAKYAGGVPASRASLAILAGHDDAGLWAVRVPGTMTTAGAALAWLEPAEVRKARDAGKRVLRQGDVYVVERTRDAMGQGDLPAGHVWEPGSRTLVHDGHARLHVPFPARAFRQSTLAAFGSGRRRGD